MYDGGTPGFTEGEAGNWMGLLPYRYTLPNPSISVQTLDNRFIQDNAHVDTWSPPRAAVIPSLYCRNVEQC